MKVTNKNNEKKRRIKKKPIDKAKKQQVVVVAQEIKFARLLAGNEKKTRDRVLRALKKWILNCFEKSYEFKEDDFIRVWKGLFYAVWMSDKPLVQEELCESIAAILDLFPPEQLHGAMLLARAGFKVLATEWFGIDHHRIDKFLMLVRRYLRGGLRCVRRCSWSQHACSQFADMLSDKDGILSLKTPLYARNATSMVVHITDCYLEEISKVSSGDIPAEGLCALMRPFIQYLAHGSSAPLCVASRRLLYDLIKHADTEDEDGEDETEQNSDEDDDEGPGDGGENSDGNGEGDTDDDVSNGPLDPRAGRVDVTLRQLPVPAPQLIAMLKATLPQASGAGNRRARRCIDHLEQLVSGRDPFAPPPPVLDTSPPIKPSRAARALRALEKKLVADGDELALRGLSRKHRKRLLAKSRAGHSIVDEVQNAKTDKHTNANDDWKVEEAGDVIKNAKKKRKHVNKENVAEPKNKRQKVEKNHNVVENGKVKKQKKGNNIKELRNSVKDDKNSVKVGKNSVKDGKNNVKDVKNSVKDIKNNVKNVKNNVKGVKDIVKDVKVKENNVKAKSDAFINNVKDTKDVKVKNKKEKSKTNDPKLLVNKIKKFQKQDKSNISLNELATPKKVKFVLKNNSMQGPVDYYKSVRQSPNIPFDSSKVPSKTNLKVNTPSPINPFFKKKMTRRASLVSQIFY